MAKNTEVLEPLKDFKVFLCLVWKYLNLPRPTPAQLDIADYLQSDDRRKVIEGFRGIGKSWITSAFVVWKLYMDPQLNFLVVSASKERADSFSTFTLRIINEIPILHHLIPTDKQRCSMIAFDVAPAEPDHAPSVKSVGIFGQMTGSRADYIIADDVESANNSDTQLKRDKLAETIKEFEAILKPNGCITFLGTPQTEMSIYNALPDRGYDIRIWSARYPNDEYKCDEDRLAPMFAERLKKNPELAGEPTDPQRFDDKDLLERELSYGKSGFALQFMLDTSLSDSYKYPLKIGDMIVYDTDKELAPEKIIWSGDNKNVINELYNCALSGDRFHRPGYISDTYLPYTTTVMGIDCAGRGTDETAVCVIKSLNGNLFVRRCVGFRDGYSKETLKSIVKIAKEEKVNKILLESNFGDGMFTALLQPYLVRDYPCTCEEIHHSTQKEKRIIETLEPVLNQHRLILDPKVIKDDIETTRDLPPEDSLAYKLIYQLTRINKTKGSLRHDDRVDTLAMTVAYFVNQMKQDQDKMEAQRRSRLIDYELEVFYSHGKHSNFDKINLGWLHKPVRLKGVNKDEL